MITYFQNRQKDLLSAYATSSKIAHNLIIGNERELIAKRFLEEHMPSDIEFSKGILIGRNKLVIQKIDRKDKPEIDIIIHKKSGSPLTLFGGTKIFFSENVACVVEVKSKLNKNELKNIKAHCAKIKSIEHANNNGLLNFSNYPSPTIPYYVICFETNFKISDIVSYFSSSNFHSTPDGFFCLNNKNGFSIVKDNYRISAYTTMSNPLYYKKIENSIYAGHITGQNTLLNFWVSLLHCIEIIQNMKFPLQYYSEIIRSVQDK